MPFTFAHPVAATPFKRYGLVLSALILGSGMPDFEYFIEFSFTGLIGHTLAGLFVFCLPFGLAVYACYQWVLKIPFFLLLPRNLQMKLGDRISDSHLNTLSSTAKVILSLLLGAVTHLVWDSFTHPTGWFVGKIPVLSIVVLVLSGKNVYLYKLLQYLSTVLGVAVLMIWFWNWHQNAQSTEIHFPVKLTSCTKGIIIAAMAAMTLASGWLGGVHKVKPINDPQAFNYFLSYAAVYGISVLFIELIVYGLIMKFILLTRKKGDLIHES